MEVLNASFKMESGGESIIDADSWCPEKNEFATIRLVVIRDLMTISGGGGNAREDDDEDGDDNGNSNEGVSRRINGTLEAWCISHGT